RPVAASQTATERSQLAVARRAPSGPYARALTPPPWPARGGRTRPVAASRVATSPGGAVASRAPGAAAKGRPAGPQARAVTGGGGGGRGRGAIGSSRRPVARSQTAAARSRPPVASRRPSGLKARAVTVSEWARSVPVARPVAGSHRATDPVRTAPAASVLP